jgi:guanosine-3',5'-bis(diphosphate) 3'-pyrophosphohydrolase
VNGAIVPLRYKLRNGDVVEVITNASQHALKDWLDFVVHGPRALPIRGVLAR